MANSPLLALPLGGGGNNEFRVQAVWNKGRPIPNYDPNVWRYDDDGRVIKRSDYGKSDSRHGWQIVHIVASALGGLDGLANLRPLHCKGNASRGGILGGLLGK